MKFIWEFVPLEVNHYVIFFIDPKFQHLQCSIKCQILILEQ